MAFRCQSCTYASDNKQHLVRHVNRKSSTCRPLSEKLLRQRAGFVCRHEGCEKVYTIDTNRLRHEKKCVHGSGGNTSGNSGNKVHRGVLGNHNIVDNSVHNVNVTVNITAFDEFRPSDITRKKFLEYMTQGTTNVILKALEDEQFNLTKPENMNVFVSNLKDRIARVYDGFRWRIRDGDDVVDQVLENYVDMINDSIDEFDHDDQVTSKTVARWKRNIEKEEFELHAKKQLLYQLHDLRDVVKDTHQVSTKVGSLDCKSSACQDVWYKRSPSGTKTYTSEWPIMKRE